MGEVTLRLNGRAYRLACEDGEEERLEDLGAHLRAHIDRLRAEFGQIGDDRMLVMAALMITDELFEAREASRASDAEKDNPRGEGSGGNSGTAGSSGGPTSTHKAGSEAGANDRGDNDRVDQGDQGDGDDAPMIAAVGTAAPKTTTRRERAAARTSLGTNLKESGPRSRKDTQPHQPGQAPIDLALEKKALKLEPQPAARNKAPVGDDRSSSAPAGKAERVDADEDAMTSLPRLAKAFDNGL